MKKDDEGGLILTEKYNLSQASGICGVSEAEALVCGKSTTESLRSLLFSGGKSLTEKYSVGCTKKRALCILCRSGQRMSPSGLSDTTVDTSLKHKD